MLYLGADVVAIPFSLGRTSYSRVYPHKGHLYIPEKIAPRLPKRHWLKGKITSIVLGKLLQAESHVNRCIEHGYLHGHVVAGQDDGLPDAVLVNAEEPVERCVTPDLATRLEEVDAMGCVRRLTST